MWPVVTEFAPYFAGAETMFWKRLRHYCFGLNDTERQEYYRAQAALLPTPDGRPVPAPVDPEADALPAVKNWCHPFRDKNHSLHQLTQKYKTPSACPPKRSPSRS